MTLIQLLDFWKTDPTVQENIVAWHAIPLTSGIFVPFPEEVHPALKWAIQEAGIQALYRHQLIAWNAVSNGENIIISTSTSSGKTICYNLPTLNTLLSNENSRALYLFPTKALAQDQLAILNRITRKIVTKPYSSNQTTSLQVSVYDGDTPKGMRTSIRKQSRIVISNPDMLHTGILPHHTAWSVFFENLCYVILDEIHVYRGVFGSHIANVIRRLKRILNFYGAHPVFILASATIANPLEHAERLTEEKFLLIDQDDAGHGEKNFILYNPPLINRDLGIRRSAFQESLRLADDLLKYDVQTIIFSRSRRSIELLLTYLRQIAFDSHNKNAKAESSLKASNNIRGYRSGYLAGQRREIEKGLRRGTVRTVITTNALELGIDIGGMEAALLVGYPGTISSTLQQAGRAGRWISNSTAILIASTDPLDQFLVNHPEYFFDRTPEQALINPDNLLILLSHLRCAVFELPFNRGDRFGTIDPDRLVEILEFLRDEGEVHHSGDHFYWMSEVYPSQLVSLRSTSSSNVLLKTNDKGSYEIIGEVDTASAHWMVHPGAIYLHEGQIYRVESLSLDNHIAELIPIVSDYYTEPRLETNVQLIETLLVQQAIGAIKSYGEIKVSTRLVGFRKIKWSTQELLGVEDIESPTTELLTTAYWVTPNTSTIDQLREEKLWSNDPNEYGPDWKTQSEIVRIRDNFHCQVCGIPEQGRSHDVHHIIPFRMFRDDLGNPDYVIANRLDNLTTLCQACHRRAEIAVRIRSGLSGMAHVLRYLAPLYLMCDPRDLGVHADPRSPLSGGNPSVILYDQTPAGIGLSQRLFEIHEDLLFHALELVRECNCSLGCPSCIGPTGEGVLGGKLETLALLEKLTSHDYTSHYTE